MRKGKGYEVEHMGDGRVRLRVPAGELVMSLGEAEDFETDFGNEVYRAQVRAVRLAAAPASAGESPAALPE